MAFAFSQNHLLSYHIMRYLDTILELIFPSSCLACTRRGSDLCNACLASLPLAERECAEWIFPLFDYRHPSVKGAIFLFKYKGRKRLAKILGQALYERMLEELKTSREPCLSQFPSLARG
jgi:predicted amidophosphoribosyltransferase